MFTEEEIKTAKATRDAIIRDNIEVLKGIYMAGEICMWDEMQEKLLNKNVYATMEEYAKEQMINLIENISRQPIQCYSQKIRGQEMQYFLGRAFVDNIIESLKK